MAREANVGLGPLLIAADGPELTAQEREMLGHPAVGGVVLFTRNFTDRKQLSELTAQIKALREPPVLIGVDQEGGRVQRFRAGFTRLPPVAALGRLYFWEPQRAIELTRQLGWLMAAELRACNIDLSFAPVLDLDRGVSSVIGDRAFNSQPQAVIALAQAWINGMRQAGMAAVGKHFPGHGAVAADSHVAQPCDERPLATIAGTDLLPFQRLAVAGLPAMMAAHVIYPEVDEYPAGFSASWIGAILRRRIGFHGAVFSDDLGMAAAACVGSYRERVASALQAGCDGALLCDREGAAEVLSAPVPSPPEGKHSQLRLARLFGRPAQDWRTLTSSAVWQRASAAMDSVAEIFYEAA